MDFTREFRIAWDFVEHTAVSVFLTGKAGTGKTTFLHHVAQHSSKSMVVVAPTGVAAINAGGVTIHSFFQLPPQPYIPGTDYKDKFNFSKKKLKIIKSLDLLVIDEVSMVRSDLLDAIDNALRKYRRSHEPFGGVQLLMIGDLHQLTPVTTPQDDALLAKHYATPYFFGSRALSAIKYVTISLSKIFRQSDRQFVSLLNAVRNNQLTDTHRQLLNSRYIPNFTPSDSEGYIRLTTHNVMADAYNRRRMDALTTSPFTYKADIDGDFPENTYPTARNLVLKKGAQVMFVKNDSSGEHRYYNGKIGIISTLNTECVVVKCQDDGQEVEVNKEVWENTRYTVNSQNGDIETEVIGTFAQLPLRHAWAITVHKSQGLTFDKTIIDAGQAFAPGQVYVALSRCRTIGGIVLATPIPTRAILTDTAVGTYIDAESEKYAAAMDSLNSFKEAYHRRMLGELFIFYNIAALAERMQRLLVMHGGMAAEKYAMQWAEAIRAMAERISNIAYKWTTMLETASFAELESPSVIERVKRGAGYFADALQQVFHLPLHNLKNLPITNKLLKKRLGETYEDLESEYKMKLSLLEKFSADDFTVADYTEAKRISLLQEKKSIKTKKTPQARPAAVTSEVKVRPAKKARSKKAKEPKVPSAQITVGYWQQEMTIKEIALLRGVTESTIRRHILDTLPVETGLLFKMFGKENVESVISARLRNEGADKDDIYTRELQNIMTRDQYLNIYYAISRMKNG